MRRHALSVLPAMPMPPASAGSASTASVDERALLGRDEAGEASRLWRVSSLAFAGRYAGAVSQMSGGDAGPTLGLVLRANARGDWRVAGVQPGTVDATAEEIVGRWAQLQLRRAAPAESRESRRRELRGD